MCRVEIRNLSSGAHVEVYLKCRLWKRNIMLSLFLPIHRALTKRKNNARKSMAVTQEPGVRPP